LLLPELITVEAKPAELSKEKTSARRTSAGFGRGSLMSQLIPPAFS
jgi:hypothetical protein